MEIDITDNGRARYAVLRPSRARPDKKITVFQPLSVGAGKRDRVAITWPQGVAASLEEVEELIDGLREAARIGRAWEQEQ